MKVQTMFRLGAIAAVITAAGDAMGNLLYLSDKSHTLFFAWFFIVITTLHVFAVIALFAAQADRGEVFPSSVLSSWCLA